MSGGRKPAKVAGGRPLDGGLRLGADLERELVAMALRPDLAEMITTLDASLNMLPTAELGELRDPVLAVSAL
jgi:hypothetical protein